MMHFPTFSESSANVARTLLVCYIAASDTVRGGSSVVDGFYFGGFIAVNVICLSCVISLNS